MENISFENQGSSTYLVYHASSDEHIDSMSLGMITNNTIEGFANTVFTQLNMERLLKYNVTALITVKQFFEGVVNRKRIVGVFKNIADSIILAEEYMIDPSYILLDVSSIYVDISTMKTSLICLPIEEKKQMGNIRDFFRDIVMSTQFDQSENCGYVANLMNFLNSSTSISLEAFSELLSGLSEEENSFIQKENQPSIAKPVENPIVTPVAPAPVPAPVSAPVTPEPKYQAPAQSISVPQNSNSVVSSPAPVENTSTNEKPMSMFYLLQHYTKENKAIYDAQKKNKKKEQAAPAEKANGIKNAGFNIPGQPSNPGFNIPGQNPVPAVNVSAQNSQAQSNVLNTPKQQDYAPKASVQIQTPNPGPIVQQSVSTNTSVGKLDFGETVMLGSYGGDSEGTIMLTNSPVTVTVVPVLRRLSNNEQINISKQVFHIGREASYADYCVNNPAVGRVHADIVTKENEYYIIDQNSRNHTYVNDSMISSQQEVKLNKGDKIKLANEEFIFDLV